jgi:hypothetical protein
LGHGWRKTIPQVWSHFSLFLNREQETIMVKKEQNSGKGPDLTTPVPSVTPLDRAGPVSTWDLLKPTINHDLPNLLVALRGLLQMLKAEEGERLSPTGQDYLQRLSAVSQKLQNMVAGLRQINKVSSLAAMAEDIVLAELVREVAAAAKKLAPGLHLVVHSALKVPRVRAPRLLLHQALLEMIRLLTLDREAGDFHCFLASRRHAGKVELAVGVKTLEGGDSSASEGKQSPVPAKAFFIPAFRKLDYHLFGLEQRLGLVLIEELARHWGGAAATSDSAELGKWVCVTVPGE